MAERTDVVTTFRLQRVASRVGPVALVTIDNGADWQKPNTFGREALESLASVLDELETGDWRGLVLTGKPLVFAAGADIKQFPDITPELARLGGAGRAPALRPSSPPALSHTGRDQRRGARWRRRDRAALRLPHDRIVRAPHRVPRGVPRA